MLAMNVIELSRTHWVAPIVIAPKKNRTLGFFVEYRKLNAVTIQDSYLILGIDECIDSLGKSTLLSALETISGYWQGDVIYDNR